MNFAPSDWTCSSTAGRVSKASTRAPSRFAVAIACSPATPAPITKTRAGRIVPAGVIIIGKAIDRVAAAVNDRGVARQVRLRTEHVHLLRERGARQHLQANGADVGRGQGLRTKRALIEGVEQTDVDAPPV